MSARALRTLFAIVAVVFFATPVTLRAVGVTANPFENRRLAEAPSLSQGWDAFDQATRFLTDRMPLREEAVRADSYISRHIFDTTPRYAARGGGAETDRALPFAGAQQGDGAGAAAAGGAAGQATRVDEGKHGWLYLADEFTAACSPTVPVERAVTAWRRLVSIVRASGRRAVVLVAPDKGSIYPEHVSLGHRTGACARRGKERLWNLLERTAHSDDVIPLRRALLSRKRRSRKLLYSRTDSHWNQRGATTLVEAALRRVGGRVGVARGEIVERGNVSFTGDLTTLLGDPQTETGPRLEVHRSARARRVRGRTVYVLDSFGDIVNPQLIPYIEQFRRVPWDTPPRQLLDAIAGADTVIFQVVERDFTVLPSAGGELSPAFLRGLRARLSIAKKRR